MAVDVEYYESAAIVIIVLNSISFVTLGFVIVIYFCRWKYIASFPMRLSFYLCLSSMVQSLYVLIYNPILVNREQSTGKITSGYCDFESILKVTSDLSSILWTSIIIFSTYASVVLRTDLQNKERWFLVVGYIFPFFVALIPIFFNLYGFNVYYCWFDTDTIGLQILLKVCYFYGPLWLFFFLEIFWSVRTYQTLKKLGLPQRQLSIFKKLLLFPLILLITGVFSTVDLIYVYSTNSFIAWLDIVSEILLNCYGMLVSIAYGLNPLIRDHILMLLRCKDKKQVEQYSQRSQSQSMSTSRNSEKLAELINY